jgi:parallel beta-helix repeat protein
MAFLIQLQSLRLTRRILGGGTTIFYRTLAFLIGTLIAAGVVSAGTIHVDPGGSGDATTITDGVFTSSAGDTILVACGTYYENNIPLWEGRTILSETGDPQCVIVDGGSLERVFTTVCCLDSTPRLEGVTVQAGSKTSSGGGAIWCNAPVRIHNCVFRDNYTAQYGGAIAIYSADPRISSCVFEGNIADNNGGAIYVWDSSPNIDHCTFIDNVAGSGGAISASDATPFVSNCVFSGDSCSFYGAALWCRNSANPTLANCTFYGESPSRTDRSVIHLEGSSPATMEKCIVAFTKRGKAFLCEEEESTPDLTCCDIYGNAGGDWVDRILDQAGASGNFSEDPLFCGAGTLEFTVEACSPCLPGNHPSGYDCGGIVGALGMGCSCGGAVHPVTWGDVKFRFR